MTDATSGAKPLGLTQTFAILAETRNEAALAVLVPALDARDAVIQEGALRALLARRSPIGQREILRHLHRGGERWRATIGEGRDQLSYALRDAVLGSDAQLCANACDAILWFREYDLMQPLITAAEDDSNENAPLAARTLLALAELLYEQLASPRDYADRRDPQLVRAHVVASLENAIRRFGKHGVKEILKAFLILAGRDNAVLKQILIDPMHPVYLPVVDELLHDERVGVLRLLLSYLDDPHAPSAAMGVLARRCDLKFVQLVLRKIGFEPSVVASANLKRVDNIPWLRGQLDLLDQLDETAQHSAVRMLIASNVKRPEALHVLEHLLACGKPAGRRMAAQALEHFQGADANALALKALEDDDPRVQAAVVLQLRARGIPGALSRLIDLVDSPHEGVRLAAAESLGEFDYDRYVAAFDLLEEEVRHSTGLLVKKINPHAIHGLRQEMKSQSRTRRLRGLQMATAMEAVQPLQGAIVELLADEDHLVRAEAAKALAACDGQKVRQALQDALHDRAVIVQETAEQSLRMLAQTQRQPARRSVAGTATIDEVPQ